MYHRLGALPPVATGLPDLSTYATLPRPPASLAVPKVAAWGQDGNSIWGDCVLASAAHCIAAWDAELGGRDPIPTDAEVVAQYQAITGSKKPGDSRDTGLALGDVLHQWATKGLFQNNKIAAYAPLNIKSILDIHQAVSEYGAAYAAVALPQSAEDQFSAGESWTYVGDAPVGGHAICFLGYKAGSKAGPGQLYACTWGSIVAVDWDWWAAYGQEVYCIIPQAFVEAGKGPELDLTQLQADIHSLKPAKKAWWKL